jgi:hypothetical protein
MNKFLFYLIKPCSSGVNDCSSTTSSSTCTWWWWLDDGESRDWRRINIGFIESIDGRGEDKLRKENFLFYINNKQKITMSIYVSFPVPALFDSLEADVFVSFCSSCSRARNSSSISFLRNRTISNSL